MVLTNKQTKQLADILAELSPKEKLTAQLQIADLMTSNIQNKWKLKWGYNKYRIKECSKGIIGRLKMVLFILIRYSWLYQKLRWRIMKSSGVFHRPTNKPFNWVPNHIDHEIEQREYLTW